MIERVKRDLYHCLNCKKMGGEEGLGVTTGQPNLYKQDLSKLVSRDIHSCALLQVNDLTSFSCSVIIRGLSPHCLFLFNSIFLRNNNFPALCCKSNQYSLRYVRIYNTIYYFIIQNILKN